MLYKLLLIQFKKLTPNSFATIIIIEIHNLPLKYHNFYCIALMSIINKFI